VPSTDAQPRSLLSSSQYVANQSTGMMYVVDAADSFQLAASAAAFHHLCGLPALDGKPVLLVLNKIDSPRVLARGDIEATFDIDAARAVLGARLTVIEASALTGANIEAVMKWTRNAVLGDEDRGRR
jgi:50S ribosomal subunit-associated GTPase HflX